MRLPAFFASFLLADQSVQCTCRAARPAHKHAPSAPLPSALSLTPTPARCRRSEATIYQEGYRQGAAEAAAHFAGGAQLAVKAAISRALVEEEGRRSQALEEAVAALRKTQYRCVGARRAAARLPSPRRASRLHSSPPRPLPCRAPQKPLECQAEEAAVLACHAAAADCAPAIDAYARCAKAVVDSRMHPKLG